MIVTFTVFFYFTGNLLVGRAILFFHIGRTSESRRAERDRRCAELGEHRDAAHQA